MKRMIVQRDNLNDKEELPQTPVNAEEGCAIYKTWESEEYLTYSDEDSSAVKCNSCPY